MGGGAIGGGCGGGLESDFKSEVKKAKLETKALKAKRPGFTDERYNETSYYHEPENGELKGTNDSHFHKSNSTCLLPCPSSIFTAFLLFSNKKDLGDCLVRANFILVLHWKGGGEGEKKTSWHMIEKSNEIASPPLMASKTALVRSAKRGPKKEESETWLFKSFRAAIFASLLLRTFGRERKRERERPLLSPFYSHYTVM